MLAPLSQPVVDRRGQKNGDLAKALVPAIWRLDIGMPPREAGFYLGYYDAKVDLLDLGKVNPSTHLDVSSIINFVRYHRNQTLEMVEKQLREASPLPAWLVASTPDAASHALLFGASLWLFIDPNQWKKTESLSGFVEQKTADLAVRRLKMLPDSLLHFNARMLSRIAGMELVWTSNIFDHLRLDLEDPKTPQLFLFRHASFLKGRHSLGSTDVFPDRFLSETAETIALLFPFAETNQKRWHKRIRRKADLDVEAAISCNTPRNLDHYHFWHDRLALIQLTFDQSKPDSMKQWWYDKRDSDKFYTYWYAVLAICLTLIFGLVQSITGMMQVIRH